MISGGVASNDFIMDGLQRACDDFSCNIVRPPRHLCTDNGIMIAWYEKTFHFLLFNDYLL